MKTGSLLVATRSAGKIREIRRILREAGLAEPTLLTLGDAGVVESPAEEEIEVFDTFEQNALAKARYFCRLSGLLTLADDSGLCVDALGGAPGVRSKRFSGRADLRGEQLDAANNARLLEALRGVRAADRAAHYVCVAALVAPTGDERLFRGTCDGVILPAPRGDGGFGYDPLFFLPEERATFGELPAERKNEISHRARAVRAAAASLPALDGEGPRP